MTMLRKRALFERKEEFTRSKLLKLSEEKSDDYFKHLGNNFLNIFPKQVLEKTTKFGISLEDCIILSKFKLEWQQHSREHIISDVLPSIEADIFDRLKIVFLTSEKDLDFSIAYIEYMKSRFSEEKSIFNKKMNVYSQSAGVNGCVNLLKILLKNGADFSRDSNIFCFSVRSDKSNTDTVAFLIQNGAKVNMLEYDGYDLFPSRKKEYHRRLDTIKLLLKKGLDPHIFLNGLRNAANAYADLIFSDEELIQFLLLNLHPDDYKQGGLVETLIHALGSNEEAIDYSISTKAVQTFLETIAKKGYIFNHLNDFYALINAVNRGNRELAKIFISYGIDPYYFDFFNRIKALKENNESKEFIIIKAILEEIDPVRLSAYMKTVSGEQIQKEEEHIHQSSCRLM